jgi:hypothetical protein
MLSSVGPSNVVDEALFTVPTPTAPGILLLAHSNLQFPFEEGLA